MGTRHLTIIFYKGKYVVVQYGQWDGYPEGQGKTVVEFILVDGNLARLIRGLKFLRSPTDAEKIEISQAINHLDRIKDPDQQLRFAMQTSRTGAKILQYISDSDVNTPVLKSKYDPMDQLDFIFDYICCEWAYLLDLDENKLEVYSGGRQVGDKKTRFTDMPREDIKIEPNLVYQKPFAEIGSLEQFLHHFDDDK